MVRDPDTADAAAAAAAAAAGYDNSSTDAINNASVAAVRLSLHCQNIELKTFMRVKQIKCLPVTEQKLDRIRDKL